MAVEYAPKEKRGLFGSVPQMGVPIGLVLGTFAMSLIAGISGDAFYSWGWRIPFVLSIVLVLIGLWIRNGIDETPVFKKARESGEIAKVPLHRHAQIPVEDRAPGRGNQSGGDRSLLHFVNLCHLLRHRTGIR